jgi:hypothetical protein
MQLVAGRLDLHPGRRAGAGVADRAGRGQDPGGRPDQGRPLHRAGAPAVLRPPLLAIIALVTVVGIPLGLGLLAALLLIYALGYSAAAWILGRSLVRDPTAWAAPFQPAIPLLQPAQPDRLNPAVRRFPDQAAWRSCSSGWKGEP